MLGQEGCPSGWRCWDNKRVITRLLVTLKAVLGISREKVTAVTCSLSLTPLSHSQADGDDHQQIQIFFLPLCRHTINLISILNSRLPGEDRVLSARPFTCSLTLDHQISLSNQRRINSSSTGQRPKNLGGRVALPSGKFLCVRKVFARNP